MTSNAGMVPKIHFRLAQTGDLDALCNIESRSFDNDRLSRRAFRRFVGSKTACLIIAEKNAGVIGYALVIFRRNVALARLYSMAVLPESCGQGVGRALINQAEEHSLDFATPILRLEVSQKNMRAIKIFRGSRYREFALYPDYYPDHSDALRMEKVLVPSTMRLPYPGNCPLARKPQPSS